MGVIKELAVERYRFLCPKPGCEHSWSADYDVQHIEDGHGHIWEYYSLNGAPATPPTAAGSVSCPRCGATRVWIDLLASRDIPLANQLDPAQAADRPRQSSDPAQRETRRQAPLLEGQQPTGPLTTTAADDAGTDPPPPAPPPR